MILESGNRDNIEQQVLEFVAQQTAISIEKLTLKSRLFHDLGIDGDDGIEFLEAFSIRFNVNLERLEISDRFGFEAGVNPLSLILWLFSPSFRQGKQFLPISIFDLVAAARAKQWLIKYSS